jgi:molecular chaperone GrpE
MSKKEKVEETDFIENNEEVVAEQEQREKTEEEKAEEESNRYLRLYSEFENFRKRTQKEKLDLFKTAAEDVLKDLIPILDDLERAQKANETAEDIQSVKQGFTLIYDKLTKILKQKGLEAIPTSIGEKLDIEKHEAITQIPAPSEEMKEKIIDEVEKGYILNGKVIRYTKVVIGQ